MEIYLNGQYVSSSEAQISAFDRGFLFGDGIFTTIKVECSVPLFLDRHLVRLNESCRFFGITYPDIPFDQIVSCLLERNQLVDARVKIIITRGNDHHNRIVSYPSDTPTVGILVFSLQDSSPSSVSLTVADAVRGAEPIYHHKTTSYLQNLVYKTCARQRGFDDCIILDWRQFLCETSTANIFFIKQDAIITPPAELPLLNGIVRQSLLAQGSLGEYSITEDFLKLKDLESIDAAFITSAILEICPVRQIDRRSLRVHVSQTIRTYWIEARKALTF